jgi:hypothetical protein
MPSIVGEEMVKKAAPAVMRSAIVIHRYTLFINVLAIEEPLPTLP